MSGSTKEKRPQDDAPRRIKARIETLEKDNEKLRAEVAEMEEAAKKTAEIQEQQDRLEIENIQLKKRLQALHSDVGPVSKEIRKSFITFSSSQGQCDLCEERGSVSLVLVRVGGAHRKERRCSECRAQEVDDEPNRHVVRTRMLSGQSGRVMK